MRTHLKSKNVGISMLSTLAALGMIFSLTGAQVTQAAETQASSKVAAKATKVTISTSMGDIKVELDGEKAPRTVENFLKYVKEKHYDGTIFHRVIPGFMIQGGGLTPDMKFKSGEHNPIKIESNNGLKNLDGTIAMARKPDPDSASDQFFINVKDNAFLDYQSEQNPGYTVFGKVTAGRDIVQKIVEVQTTTRDGNENVPVDAVTIKSVRVTKK